MPLEHRASEKAFEHNIKKEIEAGKPRDQAVAIAYSVKREAAQKNAKEELPRGTAQNPVQGKVRGGK